MKMPFPLNVKLCVYMNPGCYTGEFRSHSCPQLNTMEYFASITYSSSTMFRRPATTIKLTPEDVLEYDDSVAVQKTQLLGGHIDLNQELETSQANLPIKEPSVQGRNERMGVTIGH